MDKSWFGRGHGFRSILIVWPAVKHANALSAVLSGMAEWVCQLCPEHYWLPVTVFSPLPSLDGHDFRLTRRVEVLR